MDTTDNSKAAQAMPMYQSYKKVSALKIKEITLNRADKESTGAVITPVDDSYGQFSVDAPYMDKHKPQVGGYFVVYDDGYKSFSPAHAFESGYTRIHMGGEGAFVLRKLTIAQIERLINANVGFQIQPDGMIKIPVLD